EPHVPFLQGLRTHVAGVVSSSFSCFSIVARTISLVSYPNTRKQEKLEKFPNSVVFGDCEDGEAMGRKEKSATKPTHLCQLIRYVGAFTENAGEPLCWWTEKLLLL